MLEGAEPCHEPVAFSKTQAHIGRCPHGAQRLRGGQLVAGSVKFAVQEKGIGPYLKLRAHLLGLQREEGR